VVVHHHLCVLMSPRLYPLRVIAKRLRHRVDIDALALPPSPLSTPFAVNRLMIAIPAQPRLVRKAAQPIVCSHLSVS
jgi:hypothetical protein